jgi:hypothetical protein
MYKSREFWAENKKEKRPRERKRMERKKRQVFERKSEKERERQIDNNRVKSKIETERVGERGKESE